MEFATRPESSSNCNLHSIADIITDCTKMRAEIFRSIEGEEIKMKSDLSDLNTVGDSEPRWDKLLESMGQRQHKPFVAAPQMASVHGRDMFLVSWDRIIAAFSVVFETTEDKKVRSPPFGRICNLVLSDLHNTVRCLSALSGSCLLLGSTWRCPPLGAHGSNWSRLYCSWLTQRNENSGSGQDNTGPAQLREDLRVP